jgi:flagellar biosynthesis protein FlhF
MKVKKYAASSMTEAMKQIRADLGNEAVILSSKPIFSGGFLGLFRKRSIEVVAAVDPQLTPASKPQVRKEKPRKQPVVAQVEKTEKSAVSNPIAPEKPTSDILKEIAGLKEMLKDMNNDAVMDVNYPAPLKEIYRLLEKQEIDSKLRKQFMDTLLEKWFTQKGSITDSEIFQWLKDEIILTVTKSASMETGFKKKYINIVGPTGVGKTTTLAKIAAESMIKHNKKVAFITTDTYRIAAIDQLQTYAKILNVPIEVAYNLEDFKNAAERFSHYDLVFIDTAGRNFRNREYVNDLKKIIDFDKDLETYLVLALTAKQKDMDEIYRQFSSIPIKQIIFTKADETSSYGAMLNFIHHHQIGTAFITDGQNVPDDIKKTDAGLIANLIVEAPQ